MYIYLYSIFAELNSGLPLHWMLEYFCSLYYIYFLLSNNCIKKQRNTRCKGIPWALQGRANPQKAKKRK